METAHVENSLFSLTKSLLGSSSSLKSEFEKTFSKDAPNSEVADFWDEKLYQLEEQNGSSNLLHHRVYLKEAQNHPVFYGRYFEKEIVGILT